MALVELKENLVWRIDSTLLTNLRRWIFLPSKGILR